MKAYPNTLQRFQHAGVGGWGAMLKFPMYQPRAVRWIATYTGSFAIAGSATAKMAGRAMRLNNIRDPHARTGVGQESVMGYATMALMYDQYRVYFTTMEGRWFPAEDQTGAAQVTSQQRAWGDGQVMFIETGTTADTSTPNREKITDSIQNRDEGDATEGLWWETTTSFPSQVLRLTEQGAQFQGANKWKVMAPRNITEAGTGDQLAIPLGRSNKNYGQRIAMSWRMADLAQTRSKAEFLADESWGAQITSDPSTVRIAAIGWGNGSHNTDAVNPQNAPVVGGYFMIKMKYYTILSQKKVLDRFGTQTAA